MIKAKPEKAAKARPAKAAKPVKAKPVNAPVETVHDMLGAFKKLHRKQRAIVLESLKTLISNRERGF